MSSTVSLRQLVVVLTLAFTATAEAAEEKIPLDKVPKAVLEAVKARFPDAKLNGAEKETTDKQVVYEINITVKDQKIDVIVTPAGKITSIEKTIAVKDLPRAVAEALEKKYPKALIKSAEAISDGAEKITKYEAIIVTADKKTLEVSFDPAGKFLDEEAKK